MKRLQFGTDGFRDAFNDRNSGISRDNFVIVYDNQRNLCIRDTDDTRKSLPDLLGVIFGSAEQLGNFHKF